MRQGVLTGRVKSGVLAIAVCLSVLPLHRSARAAQPVVTLDPTGVRVTITAAPLSEAIDALARAAGFKVTYDGPRPTAMLFNTEIRTPTVAETLFRLLDGQNFNYGVVFDRTGKKVSLLMMVGPASKKASVPSAAPAAPNSRRFAPPEIPRNEPPLLDEEPVEAEAPEPEPTAPEPGSSEPPPQTEGQAPVGGPPVPLPPSPFVPRPLVVSPFAPRYSPTPAPSPSP
jgi:hypothetical protein